MKMERMVGGGQGGSHDWQCTMSQSSHQMAGAERINISGNYTWCESEGGSFRSLNWLFSGSQLERQDSSAWLWSAVWLCDDLKKKKNMRWKTGLISARMQNGADEIISFRKRKGFCKDLGQIWKLPGWQSEAPPLPGGEGAAQVRVALISLTFTQNQAPLVWTSAAIRAALINYFKDTGKKRGALPGKGTSLPGTINLLCACHMVNSVAQQNSPPWLSSSSRVAGAGGIRFGAGRYRGVEGGGIENVWAGCDEKHMNVDMLISGCEIMQGFQ